MYIFVLFIRHARILLRLLLVSRKPRWSHGIAAKMGAKEVPIKIPMILVE
jgi:hypothetical protein